MTSKYRFFWKLILPLFSFFRQLLSETFFYILYIFWDIYLCHLKRVILYTECPEFKCQNFETYRESVTKKKILKICSFFLRFRENRKKRQNIVFIIVLIYYLFIHTYLFMLLFS